MKKESKKILSLLVAMVLLITSVVLPKAPVVNATTGPVNGFGVFFCPAPKLFQYVHFFLGYASVFARADVKKQIASVAQAVDKGSQQHIRCLEVGVGGLPPP